MENDLHTSDETSDTDDYVNMNLTRKFAQLLESRQKKTDPNEITSQDVHLIQQQQELFYDIFRRATNQSESSQSIAALYLAYNSILKQTHKTQDAWVIRTLRRICAQQGSSWEEKFQNLNDAYIKHVERLEIEQEKAMDALYTAQSAALRRRNLLLNSFLKMKEELVYRHKVTQLAEKRHQQTLKRRVLHELVVSSALLSRRTQMATQFNQKILKTAFLFIMQDSTRSVVSKMQSAERIDSSKLLGRCFGWWRTKTSLVMRNQNVAETVHNELLLRQTLRNLRIHASSHRMIHSRDKELLRKIFEGWRWNAAQSSYAFVEAKRSFNTRIVTKYWYKLLSAHDKIKDNNLKAARFDRTNTHLMVFHLWKSSLKLTQLQYSHLAQTNAKLVKNVLDSWRSALLLKLEAKRFRQHSLLHTGVATFTLGLKVKIVQKRRDDDLKGRIMTMWRFKSRARLTDRVNNAMTAKNIISRWRGLAREKSEKRALVLEKKTRQVNQIIARRFLHIWRDHLEDVASGVLEAENYRRVHLLTLGVGKMMEKMKTIDEMNIEAESQCNINVARSFLHFWHANMLAKQEVRNDRKIVGFRHHRNKVLVRNVFSKWKSTFERVSQDMEVAENLFIEKDILTMREVLRHWQNSATISRGLLADAASIDNQRRLNAHFGSWLFKAQRVDYFNTVANNTRAKNVKKIQRQVIRKWRLRTLRMMQNQRTAREFEQNRDSRLVEPYFKKWLNKSREKSGFGPALSEEAVSYHEIRELHGFETPLRRSNKRPPTSIRLSRLRQDPSTPRTLLAPLLRKQLDPSQFTV